MDCAELRYYLMFFCILTLENGEQKDITPTISFFLDVVSIFVSFGNILLDFINTVVDIPWTSHLFFLEYEIRIYIYRNKVNLNHATFFLFLGFLHYRSVLVKERWKVRHFRRDPYQVIVLTANRDWKKTDNNIKTAFFTHLQAFQRKKKPVINFKAVLQGV